MPLGKISANQIKMAFSILSELNIVILIKYNLLIILKINIFILVD
jgi:hypothetical protein